MIGVNINALFSQINANRGGYGFTDIVNPAQGRARSIPIIILGQVAVTLRREDSKMSLFPDHDMMRQIEFAFKADSRIGSDHRNNFERVMTFGYGLDGRYIVMADNTRFLAEREGDGWAFIKS